MNKAWILTALLATASGVAQAQESVVLYGFLYSGVRTVSNSGGGRLEGLATGPSRWGVRGREDLGGGLSTIFTLESGFDVGSGGARQGNRLFGRQAFVGLDSKNYGALTLGRQYDFVASYIAPFSPPGKWNGYMAHVGDNDNLNFQFRMNNALRYVTPEFDGVQLGALYSFGEVAGEHQRNSGSSAGVRYNNGALKLSAAYFTIYNPASAVAEGNWNTVIFPSVTASSPTRPSAIVPGRMSVSAAAGQYDFGKARLALIYTRSKFDDLGDTADQLAHGTVVYQNVDLNLSYPLTPQLEGGLGYVQTRGKVDPTDFRPVYHQLNMMTRYSLSKRTSLQAGLVYQRAAGDAEHASVLFSGSAASSNNHQTMLLAGLFHFF